MSVCMRMYVLYVVCGNKFMYCMYCMYVCMFVCMYTDDVQLLHKYFLYMTSVPIPHWIDT